MARAPWFKFYPGDYLIDPDVDRLTLQAQGVLVRMWAVAWIEGSLPSDVEELARKCKVRLCILQLHMHMQELLAFFNGHFSWVDTAADSVATAKKQPLGISQSMFESGFVKD